MDDLVRRLSEGMHPVEVTLRPDKTAKAFKDCIDRGYAHIKFTGTRGGTDLGVNLDPGLTDLSHADFANAVGEVRLGGQLVLNYTKVRCTAEIDLGSLKGQGRLEQID